MRIGCARARCSGAMQGLRAPEPAAAQRVRCALRHRPLPPGRLLRHAHPAAAPYPQVAHVQQHTAAQARSRPPPSQLRAAAAPPPQQQRRPRRSAPRNRRAAAPRWRRASCTRSSRAATTACRSQRRRSLTATLTWSPASCCKRWGRRQTLCHIAHAKKLQGRSMATLTRRQRAAAEGGSHTACLATATSNRELEFVRGVVLNSTPTLATRPRQLPTPFQHLSNTPNRATRPPNRSTPRAAATRPPTASQCPSTATPSTTSSGAMLCSWLSQMRSTAAPSPLRAQSASRTCGRSASAPRARASRTPWACSAPLGECGRLCLICRVFEERSG